MNFISFVLLIFLINKVSSFDKDLFCDCRQINDLKNDKKINFPAIVSIGEISFDLDFISDRHKVATHLCSGVILSETQLLTTASCIDTYKNNLKNIGFGLNNNKANDLIKIFDDGRIPFRAIYLHPKFNNITFENDIALIETSKEIKFDRNSLYRPSCIFNKSFWFNKMNTISWGNTKNLTKPADVKYFRYLKETDLEDISEDFDDCRNNPAKLCMRSIKKISTNKNKTICNDHSSPLVYSEDGRMTVIALFSYYSNQTINDEECQSTGVYTRINKHLDFIKKYVKDNICYF